LGKNLIYIIAGVCIAALLLFVFLRPREKTFDKSIVLDKQYKTPYGLYVTYNMLPLLFPGSSIKVNRQPPSEWYDADSAADGKSIFFLVSEHFDPDKDELNYLLEFVKQGNQVFICSPNMNEAAKVYFGLGEEYNYNYSDYISDSGRTNLANPPFLTDTSWFNPGYHFSTHFFGVDSLHYTILGKDESDYPNFIKVSAGKGSFYLHSNPLLFANYFLLYHNNLDYFQKTVSLMPADKNKIIWDEYFVYHWASSGGNHNSRGNPWIFRVLWGVAAFRWAFSIGLILLSLYILLGVKLLQRAVPLFAKPKNDTLEFTKTIGRLYFEKGDNTNLAKKMATYLLEHIRNKYFIKTTEIDEDFIKNLASKSGCTEEEIKEMAGNLVYIQAGHSVTEKQLADIYVSFSKFYKHTS
jgi:hypothetical protein